MEKITKNQNTKQKFTAFDMDGVIADYHGFVSVDFLGDPKQEVVKAIKMLKDLGHKIIVYSTRGTELIKEYCKKHGIPVDYVNENPEKSGLNPYKPIAQVYVDDRAVCYRDEKAEDLVERIVNFQPYWKE